MIFRLVPWSGETNYIDIVKIGDGCSSWVGMTGGRQVITLGEYCAYRVGIPIHEVMHAIGTTIIYSFQLNNSYNLKFYASTNIKKLFHFLLGYDHEQARNDRDDYITINWDNIKPGGKSQYTKCTRCTLQNTTYDYGSVMHYSDTAFAINRSIPTRNMQ